MRSKIDSGACESVVNQRVAVDYPTFETEASKRGLGFVSASGDVMPNAGEKAIVVNTTSGKYKIMKNEVCDHTGPLTSVARTVDADSIVIFPKKESLLIDKDGTVDYLTRTEGCFELSLEIVPFAKAEEQRKASGFPRQS